MGTLWTQFTSALPPSPWHHPPLLGTRFGSPPRVIMHPSLCIGFLIPAIKPPWAYGIFLLFLFCQKKAKKAGIWSCDLRANERPQKKLHETRDKQTHRRTSRVYERIGQGPILWKKLCQSWTLFLPPGGCWPRRWSPWCPASRCCSRWGSSHPWAPAGSVKTTWGKSSRPVPAIKGTGRWLGSHCASKIYIRQHTVLENSNLRLERFVRLVKVKEIPPTHKQERGSDMHV